jgi:hypothetical protein
LLVGTFFGAVAWQCFDPIRYNIILSILLLYPTSEKPNFTPVEKIVL